MNGRKARWMMVSILAVAVGMMTGCSGEQNSAVTDLTAPVAQAAEAAGAPPTVDDLAALNLTPDQATAMAELLGAWQATHAERQGERGRGTGGPVDGERPMHAFLTESADILTSAQMVGLIGILAEQREQMMAERGDGPGAGRCGEGRFGDGAGRGPGGRGSGAFRGEGGGEGRGPGAGGCGALDELNLSEDQLAQLAALRESHHEVMQALRDEMRDSGDRDAVREARDAMRTEFHGQIAAILTPAQLEQWEAAREACQAERAQQRLDAMGERGADRLDFLAAVLKLDDSQQTALAEIHAKAQSAHAALLQAIIDGSLTRDEARSQKEDLRDATRKALEAVLNSDQLLVFEALQALRQGHGPGSGFGRGR